MAQIPLPDDGRVISGGKAETPQEELFPLIPLRRTQSISLEEAKRRLAEPEPELTPEQQAELNRLYEELSASAEPLDLPPDYANEIDHYLYGVPKRSDPDGDTEEGFWRSMRKHLDQLSGDDIES
jgi:hypothetical protein